MKTRVLQLPTFLAAFLAVFLGFAQFTNAQYCTPTYSTACGSFNMYVQSFSTTGGFVNITNNNQGCSNNSGYTYYSTLGHTTNPDSVVNFSVLVSPNYAVRVYLWVDYNQDGDFIDTGEQVAYNDNVANNSTWTSSFTIPATATSGTTRMRIRTLYYTSVGMHPCNNLPYGESEDYNLTIVNCELVATIDSSQSASCVDAEDGYAHVNVTGGSAVYSYLWSDSVTTALNENLGVGEYIVVVTDTNGCNANDTISIIFEDSIAPMVMVQNIIAYLDSAGSVTINATQIDNGSSDSCGIAQMIISDSVFSCDDTLNEVILTVFDVNGNFASDTAIVTITDTIAPSIICAESIEICESVLNLVDATTTDNCQSSVSQISGPLNGDTLMAGSYTSEFLAIDIFGNESSCSVDIMVNPLPVVELGNDSIFCDSIEFTVDAGNDGSSYDWSSGESSQTILVTDSGNYTVTVTDANGCESSSSIHVGLKVCVGIDEVGNPIYMTVYPNPTTNMVNVQIDGFANEVRYDILDINGKLVQSSNRNGVSASSVEVIDISAFSAGIYILSVKVNDKTYVQRISKM